MIDSGAIPTLGVTTQSAPGVVKRLDRTRAPTASASSPGALAKRWLGLRASPSRLNLALQGGASCTDIAHARLVVAPPRVLGLWVEHLELDDGRFPVIGEPRAVDDRPQLDDFCDHVLSDKRTLPIIALTNSRHSSYYGVDPRGLAEAVRGIAHVACIAPHMSSAVAERLGSDFGPVNGAARIYSPGFSALATQEGHPLVRRVQPQAASRSDDPGALRRLLLQRVCALSASATTNVERFAVHA